MDLYQHTQIGTVLREVRGTLAIILVILRLVLFKIVGLEPAIRCFIAAIISVAYIFIFDSMAEFG